MLITSPPPEIHPILSKHYGATCVKDGIIYILPLENGLIGQLTAMLLTWQSVAVSIHSSEVWNYASLLYSFVLFWLTCFGLVGRQRTHTQALQAEDREDQTGRLLLLFRSNVLCVSDLIWSNVSTHFISDQMYSVYILPNVLSIYLIKCTQYISDQMYSVYIFPNVLSIYLIIKCKHLKKSCLSIFVSGFTCTWLRPKEKIKAYLLHRPKFIWWSYFTV